MLNIIMKDPKSESLSDIEVMRKSDDKRLNDVAEMSINTKVIEAKIDNDRAKTNYLVSSIISLLPKLLLNVKDKFFDYCNNGELEEDIRKRIDNIPPDRVSEPDPVILVSALNNMMYSIDIPRIKEVYLNTISKTFDKENDTSLYLSYLNIIQELGKTGLELFEVFYINYFNVIDLDRMPPIYDGKRIEFIIDKKKIYMSIDNSALLDNWSRAGLISMRRYLDNRTKQKINPNIFEVKITNLGLEFIKVIS